ncbi:MAG TPA: hypothetical protein VGQ90_07370 [Stellaceae bacterium]|nr:hypothetical protein [Stellaceae bacterium]
MHRELISRQLEFALRESLDAPSLRLLDLHGERPPIDEQREPWLPIKYGAASADEWFGVVPAVARLQRSADTPEERLPLAVKVNPRQGLARGLIPWIVGRQRIALDRPYWQYRRAAQCDDTAGRERHIYALAADTPQLRRVLPWCYGTGGDDASGEQVVFLDFLTEMSRLDASGAIADWPPEAIDGALRAAAGWHAAFWGLELGEFSWAGPRPSTSDMLADEPLWRGLLDDAHRRFPDIVSDAVWRRRHRLIDTLAEWHAFKDLLPATLAHNDFNQRNVGFRPDVVVLDWELVERNTAQRDLVEMLVFVLPASADRAQIDRHVEAHRLALIDNGASDVDREQWIEGFRCEVKVEAIDRVSLQLLFAAEFPLAYIGRINATVERLLDFYE